MKKFDTKKFAQIAILMALTIVLTFLQIPTPFMNISVSTVPVAVAAITVGPVGGLICGLTFGMTSFIKAIMGTSGMLTVLSTISMPGVFVTAVIARGLDGWFVGLIYAALKKAKIKAPAYYIASFFAPVLNTVLFMSCIVIFFYNTDYVQGLVESTGASNVFMFIVLLVGIQAVVEAIVATILGGAICQALAKAFK